jgi:hypothetical protein
MAASVWSGWSEFSTLTHRGGAVANSKRALATRILFLRMVLRCRIGALNIVRSAGRTVTGEN